jgi:hypothetical protein
MSKTTSGQTEAYMLRKSILALAALATLGAAALTPTTAGATWYGHGWHGYGPYAYHKPYCWGWRCGYAYGFYGKRFFHGGKLGWRKPYGYYY